MKLKKQSKKAKPDLYGTWISHDVFNSDVHYTISRSKQGLKVAATDTSDGEKAEIRDVKQKADGRLAFTAYWPTTGRFAKCQFVLVTDDQIDFTFTFTDHDTLKRK